MSCRRIRRELLWLVRFGDFDAGSAPHLDHLASCQECRDEVGLDRALVRQLRTALAARIGDATPSPSAWDGVLARMRQPEPIATRPWTARLAGLLRAGSAMAGASLALVVALNLEIAPIGAPPSPDASGVGALTASAPTGHGSGLRHWEGRAPAAGNGPVNEAAGSVAWVPTVSEQLPLGRTELQAEPPAEAAAASGPSNNFVVRVIPVDTAAVPADSSSDTDGAPKDEPAAPAATPVGEPS
jgi:hypothetical protein